LIEDAIDLRFAARARLTPIASTAVRAQSSNDTPVSIEDASSRDVVIVEKSARLTRRVGEANHDDSAAGGPRVQIEFDAPLVKEITKP
jgi:hypothetical protein